MKELCTCTNLRVGAVLLAAGAGLAFVPSFAQTKEGMPARTSTFDTQKQQPSSIKAREDAARRAAHAAANPRGGNDGGIQGANPACPGPGDCCVANGLLGCSDEVCCNAVCDIDLFCCTVAWDGICAGEAATLCKACAPPPCDPPPANDDCAFATDGGILAAGGSIVFPGTMNCATIDCGLLGLPTGETWLKFETLDAGPVRVSYCGSTGIWSNAYIVFTSACPCDVLTFFSSFAFDCPDGNVRITWNNLAAGVWYYPVLLDPGLGAIGDYVITIESIAINCGDAVCEAPLETCANCPEDCPPPPACGAAGHDCGTVGVAGCDDVDCCCTVCAVDPFCCDVSWDGICVSEALALCTFPAPKNDNCIDRLAIGEVCEMPFSTIGATTDGPPHDGCLDGFTDPQVNQDIWYNYTATCSGDVTVSLCGSGYDTKLAVYDGCTCDVSDANLLACDDDTCALQSEVTFAATAGSCYKIRIGGFGGASGSGSLTINNSGSPCGGGDCPADLDGDGFVNVIDLLDLIEQWGACP